MIRRCSYTGRQVETMLGDPQNHGFSIFQLRINRSGHVPEKRMESLGGEGRAGSLFASPRTQVSPS